MPLGPLQHISLVERMVDKASVWDDVVAQHDLQQIPYDQIVSWGYGDFVFGAGFDIISSVSMASMTRSIPRRCSSACSTSFGPRALSRRVGISITSSA